MKPGVWIKSSRSGYNGDCVQVRWRRSSHCQNGECVEVASPGRVLVRDSKNPEGPRLAFTPAEWRRFLEELGR